MNDYGCFRTRIACFGRVMQRMSISWDTEMVEIMSLQSILSFDVKECDYGPAQKICSGELFSSIVKQYQLSTGWGKGLALYVTR